MASNPGILSDWPWKHLGSFKYLILAPWAVHSIYSFLFKEESKRDLTNFSILPLLLWRMLHNQIWISISRYQNAKGNNLLVDKSLQFEQVDREQSWDDQIILSGIISYLVNTTVPGSSHLSIWRTDGVILAILLHVGPVEFLYYWLHRALHICTTITFTLAIILTIIPQLSQSLSLVKPITICLYFIFLFIYYH
ncbi:hypothetical protein ACB092_07G172700 [Castanea dentata]